MKHTYKSDISIAVEDNTMIRLEKMISTGSEITESDYITGVTKIVDDMKTVVFQSGLSADYNNDGELYKKAFACEQVSLLFEESMSILS